MNNCIYHVFNKTIDKKRVFENEDNCRHFFERLLYYRSNKATISFSKFNRLEDRELEIFLKKIAISKYLKVDILAYCLIRTHFHFLLRQRIDGGVSKFLSDLSNSYTRYFNIKNERKGPLFLPRFKSVRMTRDEQLIHVSRYIHLHPYSNDIISNLEQLENYKWSSYKIYLTGSKNNTVETDTILSLFNNNRQRYRNFVESNAHYQKTLEMVKHLRKW